MPIIEIQPNYSINTDFIVSVKRSGNSMIGLIVDLQLSKGDKEQYLQEQGREVNQAWKMPALFLLISRVRDGMGSIL